MHLDNPDLTCDPAARRAAKDETVQVQFAASGGSLASAVGLNHYVPGDALITGSTGDRWCVSRERFDAKYLAVPPTPQGGRCLPQPPSHRAGEADAPVIQRFARGRRGRVEGAAGDWLLQYAPGDHGIVERTRFAQVYRIIGGRI